MVNSRVSTLGPDHPDALALRYDLAFRRMNLETLPHPEFVATLASIAGARERVLGHLHPDTLGTWEMLAAHVPEVERPALTQRAIQGWLQVLADRERELGSDHPDTLSARLSLGALFEGRDPQRSREMRVEAAAGWGRIAAERSRRLGPVHPETVDAREFHASLHGTFVDEADRLPLMEELTTDHERILGPDHPRTLHALVELANQYGYTDPRRLALAERIIDRVRSVLGPAHEDCHRIRHIIASAHVVAGRMDDFKAVYDRYPAPDDDHDSLGDNLRPPGRSLRILCGLSGCSSRKPKTQDDQ